MIFYIIPIFYHFVNVSASQRIKMCYNERMENNAFFWKTRRGNSGAGASLSAFSGGSFRSADPMKARLRTDPMKKLLCLLPVLLLLLLRAAAAETLWYAPEWYDAATGSMDLTGLDLSGAEGAARGWLERRLCEVPGLQYVDLSFSSLSDEELSALRGSMAEKGVKVVWTLVLGRTGYTLRTDDWVFSTRHNSKDRRLEDEDVACLRYATELRALDLGHNWLFDASFMEPMTELRVLVISDNKFSDLSSLAGKPLEYLEMFNTHVSDLSFLRGCDTLMDLNICLTRVSSLEPLCRLKNLKRLWVGNGTNVSMAERRAFLSWQEDQLEAYDFWTDIPTLYGWRGDEDGPGHPRYEIVKAIFKENTYYDFDTVLRPEQYVKLTIRQQNGG